MAIYNLLLIVFWLIFLLYWATSAREMKKIAHQEAPWRGLSILIIFVALLFLQEYVFHFDFIPHTAMIEVMGVIFCDLGIAFAIWARRHLGKSWNARPSIQEEHELVTTGPYRFVRHPIYTGVMIAVLGSTLVGGTFWFLIFILFCFELVWRIRIEERLMLQQFPNQYPDYKKRTKALIPFVL